MKYTIELKNDREKNNFIELLQRGMAYCDEHYKQYHAIDNIYKNVMSQLNTKDISIEEMRNLCNILWGWQADEWDDKTVKEYYTLYKQGYFNLK